MTPSRRIPNYCHPLRDRLSFIKARARDCKTVPREPQGPRGSEHLDTGRCPPGTHGKHPAWFHRSCSAVPGRENSTLRGMAKGIVDTSIAVFAASRPVPVLRLLFLIHARHRRLRRRSGRSGNMRRNRRIRSVPSLARLPSRWQFQAPTIVFRAVRSASVSGLNRRVRHSQQRWSQKRIIVLSVRMP